VSGRRSGTTRRAILGGLASVPAAALPGCRDGVAAGLHGIGAEPAQRRLIDAHCHVFNITDLPAASFIQEVFLKDYPDAVEPTPAERRLRWALDKIEGLLAKGVLRAADEVANSPGAGFLAEAAPALSPTDQEELDRATREAEDAARESGLGDDVAALLGCSHGTKISVRSATNWLGSLRSPRARLAMRLRDAHSASGYASALLAPALVDYSNWLGQSLRSPLPDQISAMGALAANPALPPIHGYVAFDPLRRALIRGKWRTRDGERWDPLAQARIALRDHGFIGVKLYPPMGFRPSGNAGSGQSYQPRYPNCWVVPPGSARSSTLHSTSCGRCAWNWMRRSWRMPPTRTPLARATACGPIRRTGFRSRARILNCASCSLTLAGSARSPRFRVIPPVAATGFRLSTPGKQRSGGSFSTTNSRCCSPM
jgi:hypothetical protein